MNKLLSISSMALALSAGAAFAQRNVSNIDQIGTNTVTVNQTATNSSNSSGVDQNGTGNTATVTQIGAWIYGPSSTNNSYISQSNNSNMASVTQQGTGSQSVSNLYQSGNGGTVTVNQDSSTGWGTQNSSFVNQTGNGSTVSISQDGSSTTNNTSSVYQGSSSSSVSVTQTGYVGPRNESTVNQWYGSGNTANVYQTGGQNGAYCSSQGCNPWNPGLNYSDIEQSGNGNFAGVNQTALSVTNMSTIVQSGNGNMGMVTQH